MSIDLVVQDDSGLVAIKRLLNLLGDDTLLDQGGAMLLDRMRKRFLQEKAPDGSQWPESFAAQRRRESGRGGGTLYDTGRLFHSLQLFRSTSSEVSIGTDVAYAGKHQFGEDGLPKREFVGASDDDIELFGDLLLAKLTGAFE